MCYVPGDIVKRKVIRHMNLPNAAERRAQSVTTLTEELSQVVLKVNYHFHSGYEQNDKRIPESIFMNFFKKQPSIIHSAYLMRLKNRDFRLTLDEDRYVSKIRFTDLCYGSYPQMTNVISLLNDACAQLDYKALRGSTNTMDKFNQTTSKIIQGIKDFKF